MNVALGRAGSWSPALWPSSALRSLWGTHPPAPRPGGPHSWRSPLGPNLMTFTRGQPPSLLHLPPTPLRHPQGCLPPEPTGLRPPGPRLLSGRRSLPRADRDSLSPPCSRTAAAPAPRWADNPHVSGTVHTEDSARLVMGAQVGGRLVAWPNRRATARSSGSRGGT